ncbi:MAG: hypothetical protein GC186_16160 [Rhodobacteraceae bacterium]|nr:hypothetical protein [Paracoccaceae bacterium]
MKVVYHLGVHCTDERRLVTCLRANAEALAAKGLIVPDPEVYRPMLRNVVNAMKGKPSTPETEETILDAVMVQDEAERIVFSNDAFLCVRSWVLGRGTLYVAAGDKVAGLVNLLPSHEAEIALAIRNPATFLPALFQASKNASFDDFLGGADPLGLSWADVIGRIRAANPTVPITLWCDEDTPLIWPEVLRAVAGAPADLALEGENDLLAGIMSAEGMARFDAYLNNHPGLTASQRRRIVAAFLDKYALADQIEMELDLPNWDEALIEELSERYDDDLEEIAAMPGVTVLTP